MRRRLSRRAPRSSARRRAAQYGGTLIEALISLVVLMVATASITNILKYVGDANRRMAFQTASLDVYAEVAAQVEDARCDADATGLETRDPGLQAIIAARPNFVDVVTPTSLIRTIGLLNEANVERRGRSIPMRVSIRDLGTAPAWTAGSLGPPTFDLEVQIREIMSDPARDAPAVTSGFWIRSYPLKKICNLRADTNGRGEQYAP